MQTEDEKAIDELTDTLLTEMNRIAAWSGNFVGVSPWLSGLIRKAMRQAVPRYRANSALRRPGAHPRTTQFARR